MNCVLCFCFCFCLCSDSGGSEVGSENYCRLSGSTGKMFDVSDTEPSMLVSTICETEVSPSCPVGWAYYIDDGSEGHDSCLQVSVYTVSSWSQANSSCPTGSHLLTVESTGSELSSKLLRFASSLFYAGPAYIGCYQLSTATTPGSNWNWIDTTSPSNINCGSGMNGCGLWGSGEPK